MVTYQCDSRHYGVAPPIRVRSIGKAQLQRLPEEDVVVWPPQAEVALRDTGSSKSASRQHDSSKCTAARAASRAFVQQVLLANTDGMRPCLPPPPKGKPLISMIICRQWPSSCKRAYEPG